MHKDERLGCDSVMEVARLRLGGFGGRGGLKAITLHLFCSFLILTFWLRGVKNEFSYYNTTPLITPPRSY